LRAIEQIPFELELFKVCASSKTTYLRKQRQEKSSASQTNSTNKRLLGSQITEPISAGKVYYR